LRRGEPKRPLAHHPDLRRRTKRNSASLTRRQRLGLWYLSLVTSWILAWSLHQWLAALWPLLANRNLDTLFWIVAKFAIWILPIACYSRREGVSLGLGFPSAEATTRATLWAAGWLFCLVIRHWISPHPHARASVDLALANALLVAPLVEEIAFRGLFLGILEAASVRFIIANTIAALAFAAIHLPGWAFQHRLLWPTSAVEFATIALFGLVLGLCRRHAGSTWAPVLVHALNNAWSQLI